MTSRRPLTKRFIAAMVALTIIALTTQPAQAGYENGFTWNAPITMETIERNPVIIANADILLRDGKTRVGSHTDNSQEEFVMPIGPYLEIEGIPAGINPNQVTKVGVTFDFGRTWDYATSKTDWRVRVDTNKYAAGRRYTAILGVEGPYSEHRIKFFFFVFKSAAFQKNFGIFQVMLGDPSRDPGLDPDDPIEVFLHCRGVTPAWTTALEPQGFDLDGYRKKKAAIKAQLASEEAARLADEARRREDEARRQRLAVEAVAQRVQAQQTGGHPGTVAIAVPAPTTLQPPAAPPGVQQAAWRRAQAVRAQHPQRDTEGRAIVIISKNDGNPASRWLGQPANLEVKTLDASGQWQTRFQPSVPANGVVTFPVSPGTQLRVKIRGTSVAWEVTVPPGEPAYVFINLNGGGQ